jgi:hypothetical protein
MQTSFRWRTSSSNSQTALLKRRAAHVWRVDNGSLNEIPDLGTFFTQSVYLVLEVLFQINQKPKKPIYLWCGAFSDPEDS